jgi:hypothetical protein
MDTNKIIADAEKNSPEAAAMLKKIFEKHNQKMAAGMAASREKFINKVSNRLRQI